MDDFLKIAVCEDTAADEEKLLEILKKCRIPSECTVFHSGEELLEAYQPMKYDLLLTDIFMGGMTGVDAVTKIREFDEDIPVAFVTTSTDFALESYRLNALKYIEKPYCEKEVEEILRLALMEKNSAPAITFRRGGKDERIPLSRILYLEQQTHQMNIYLHDGSCTQLNEKLSQYVPYLEENGFFIPHKSFAVSLSAVRYIDSELKCFMMINGKNIPIRRESMTSARKELENYLFTRTRKGL